MDFFSSQDTLTWFEWVLRAIIGFIFLLIIARTLGQRTISQLRILDFVIALVIGNIIAHPLSDQHLGLKGSIITTTVLMVLYISGVYMLLKWPWFRKLVNSPPVTIVKDGEIRYEGLKKARISLDVLLEELRENQIEDVKKVVLATWEANGKVSYLLDPKYQNVTPETLGIKTEPFTHPRTIIKEGIILIAELKEIRKDEEWITSQLENLYQTNVKEVLLATVDNKDKLNVFFYG
ncbi:hypothetical protein CJ195_03925 [Bacillus sp. UMB0899]|uniref:DUF421 domain-containing protein n=1 Tax=Metabacillus schmidteae TaxID=2730405 RepID=UPI000C80ED35|nr:DUF421 domain-containing protein [Metabacillus schmidteae]PMC39098.1 hypothetical protein CJ195_03925 [Bacillus sp. UMB0899]